MTNFDRGCIFHLALNVWTYFSFLEIWRRAEIGTLTEPLTCREDPQDMAVTYDSLVKIGEKGERIGLFCCIDLHLMFARRFGSFQGFPAMEGGHEEAD